MALCPDFCSLDKSVETNQIPTIKILLIELIRIYINFFLLPFEFLKRYFLFENKILV